MVSNLRVVATVSTSLLTLCLGSPMSQAQTAPAGAGAADTGSNTVAETAAETETLSPGDIIVTAQRRSESLQNVPIAISAFTGATLTQSGVASTADLPTVTPGLTFSTSLSAATPYIRGVGTNDGSVGNESSNATYVDGFYYPSMSGAIFALSNIERIEVLKGPQGTLFGRNASGGLIHVITREPSVEPRFDAKVGYGNYDTVEASTYLSTGIGGGFATDLSLYYSNQNDGWGRAQTGEKVYKSKTFAARGKVKGQVGPVTLTVIGDYTDREGDLTRNFLPGAFSLGRVAGFTGSIYDAPVAPPRLSRTEQYGVGVRAEVELPFANLVSLTGYRRVNDDPSIDQDTTRLNLTTVDIFSTDRALTQEFQLVSNSESSFDWIVGAFYFDRQVEYKPVTVSGANLAIPFGGFFRNFARQDTRSLAGFAQATVTILPDLRLTLGGRYTADTQKVSGRREAPNPVFSVPYPNQEADFNKFTWRASLDYKITADVLVYASANRGFKAGLFNATNPVDPAAGPEVLDAYEAGIKSSLFDRLLRLNLSGFLYDYKGIQLQRIVGPFTQTFNATSAKIRGFDAEAVLAPTPDFTITAGATFLPRARYGDFPGAPITSRNPAGGNFVVAGNAGGNRIIRAPKTAFNLSANYGFDIGDGRITTSATAFRSGRFFWDPDNRLDQKTYTLVNAQIAWAAADNKFGVRLWARNITKQEYYVFIPTSVFGDTGQPAAPRTYGMSVETHF